MEKLVVELYDRIHSEIETLLAKQVALLGGQSADVKRCVYPDDPKALASYQFKGTTILGVRISDNGMAIEFDVPNLETQKGEVQCTKTR